MNLTDFFKQYFGQFLVENDSLYCLVTDPLGNIKFANQAYANFVRIDLKELTNRNVFEFFHPDDVPIYKRLINAFLRRKNIVKKNLAIRNHLNEFRYIKLDGRRLEVNGDTYIAALIQSRTNETLLAQNLQKKNKELEEVIRHSSLLINTAHIATWAYDVKRQQILWNDRLLNIFGLHEDNAASKLKRWQQYIHPKDRTQVYTAIRKLTTGTKFHDFEFRIINENGRLYYLKASSLPVFNAHGQLIKVLGAIIDESQQVLSEQEKAKQRELLEQLTNQVPGIVFIYNLHPDGSDSFDYVSKGIEDIFEIKADSVLQDSNAFWRLTLAEDLHEVHDSMLASKEHLSHWQSSYRIQTPSGKIKHINASGLPKQLKDGTIQWYSIVLDVTQQVQQQRVIEAQKLHFQKIANQIPGVILKYTVSPNGDTKALYVSNGVKEMFGLEPQQVLEDISVLWDRCYEEDVENIQASLNEALQCGSKWENLHRYYAPNNEVRYMQSFGTPTRWDNGTVEWNIITLDVTNRIIAEQRAQRSNHRLRSFIQSSPIAIFQINPELEVTDFWNPSAETVFGWTQNQVLGEKIPFLDQTNEEVFHKIITEIRNTRKPKQFRATIKNRFNELLSLDITFGPMFNKCGKLTDLLIIANDLTELEEYRKNIEKNLHEKEILLQEIHHRVKNNLAIISALLELQAFKSESEQDMSLIIEARNRIHSIAMVHEQLYQDMDYSHIIPEQYYRKLLKKLQGNTVQENRYIDYDLRFDVHSISINRAVPLGLLINELFTNSIKYAFTTGRGKLTLHFLYEGERVKVIYEDNGPGFDLNEIEQKNTIGWQLINSLLAQLDSEYEIDTNGKFKLVFSFEEIKQGSQAHFIKQ